jgi:mersacidin/lichenicidin family type 2 lantibiotic
MSKQQIIRAWKDRAYRRGLSAAERAALPENPAGRVDLDALTAAEMAEIAGGYRIIGSTSSDMGCEC